MSVNIIKLGGSLMSGQQLSCWLAAIEKEAKKNRIIIVPGGGEFADTVRQLQKEYLFDDRIAHQMALLAMCQYAHFLKGVNPNLVITTDLIQCAEIETNKPVPLLWLPLKILYGTDELQENWDFTSDSIALWLAGKLNARRLLIVKSAPPPTPEFDINNLVKAEYIDRGFQQLIHGYNGIVYFLEKNQFDQLADLLSVKEAIIKSVHPAV